MKYSCNLGKASDRNFLLTPKMSYIYRTINFTDMDFIFRKALMEDLSQIWLILQDAIQRRKEDGSEQWQDGYPNTEVIKKDILKQAGFVLTQGNQIAGYCAVMINDEPAYAEIKGQWLTDGDFAVFHRVAISKDYLGMGLSKTMLNHIEDLARANRLSSIKADTNFDNAAMLNILEKAGYVYCGEVFFRGSARRAFEKVL